MLRKRIIFSLIYAYGFFHQSRNFRLQRVGNLRWLEKNYKFQEIAFSLDELIVINASKNNKNIENFANTLSQLVDDVFIPIAAGGGIRSIADAKLLFASGADKILLNTILIKDVILVKELVSLYGSQSIVAVVDYKSSDNSRQVFIEDGTIEIDMNLEEHLTYLNHLNIGEIYLNSMDNDGTGFGYDLETIQDVANTMHIPLIVAGGAGNEKHLTSALEIESINAVATANLFNFIGDGLPNARKHIIEKEINIARWL